ncbi:MAG TPA: SPOR domain-containing protein [Nevskiaceae bacterium]|nr:SPOR domain-containing protein [Nevskiaceae bacterium]
MDEVLKRRLIGALVVLCAVFLLTLVLPRPGDAPKPEPGTQRVVIDLTQPVPRYAPAAAVTASSAPSAAPPEAPTTSTATADEPPEIETPAPEPQKMETPPPAAPAKPDAQPAATATAAAELKPTLRLEQKVSTPIPAPAPAAAAPRPVVSPTAKAPTKSAALQKAWYVQIGSYASLDNAHAALDPLKASNGLISPADTATGTLYRVRLGPYATKEQAKAARERYAPKANLVED